MKLPADKSTKSALRGKVYIWGQRETSPLLPSYLSVVNRRRADALYSFDERRRTGQQFRTMYISILLLMATIVSDPRACPGRDVPGPIPTASTRTGVSPILASSVMTRRQAGSKPG